MDQSWPSQGYYNFYPHDPSRSSDRPPPLSPPLDGPGGPSGGTGADDGGPRRYAAPSHTAFLPPPPAHGGPSNSGGSHTGPGGAGPSGGNGGPSGSGMNLPPFGSTFYGGYHGSTGSSGPTHPGSNSAPTNSIHLPPHSGISGYGNHLGMGGPTPYHYPVTSPINMSSSSSLPRAPPPHSYTESPRVAGYSSSPGMRHLSPNSPTTHLGPPNITPGGSTTSSSYPSATRTPANLPKGKRRSNSTSHSNESWDEVDSSRVLSSGKDDDGDQPWGMPQDDYKALNPRDKKQVRNRIGARRFRAKRKDYVSTIESTLRGRDDEVAQLKNQLEAQRAEINDLRHRLGMPLLPPPQDSGLGLVVSGDNSWRDVGKEDRKE